MEISILGFPRIGKNRELKKALESYWAGESTESELLEVGKDLRKEHWQLQKNLQYVCVNDFSLYDNMLDLSFALGAIPKQYESLSGLECYFTMARGNKNQKALEMTKWFNTNYHYVVPELDIDSQYTLNTTSIISQYKEATALGYQAKIQLIGLFTFFALSKISNGTPKDVFKKIKDSYLKLLKNLTDALGKNLVIEFGEPIFVKGDLLKLQDVFDKKEIIQFYNEVSTLGISAIVSTFFEHSLEFTEILAQTKIAGIGLDFVYGEKNLSSLKTIAKTDKILYAGIIDGRNIWIGNLESKLQILEQIAKEIPRNRIVLSTSCSLLHTPFSKEAESKIDREILSWLCFAKEKIRELELLNDVFRNGLNATNKSLYEENLKHNANRKNSTKIHNKKVQERLKISLPKERELPFAERIKIQHQSLKYPILPTTTIGSFPQTNELRALRKDYKQNKITQETYKQGIKNYIQDCIKVQESLGIDVLVHGEPERNDMVEYFGEQLSGFAFTQNAWVQSYGSRCVKPPIIYGDVERLQPITIEWMRYAQSLTSKIMKGMLTGPVTILNWSFVRDDLSRAVVCKQIALALRDEIDDLQQNGIKIIQVDEAAFKEGYPLRKENIAEYEHWALESFKLATSIALPQTQIHTHMCYSDFNDIIKTIEAMDADVISIETARSGNKLLKVFKTQDYQNEIGPGVYDIHSPRIPSVEEIQAQIKSLLEVLPKEQLWINPDCGLKTRKWEEVKPSLQNMVEATKKIRSTFSI